MSLDFSRGSATVGMMVSSRLELVSSAVACSASEAHWSNLEARFTRTDWLNPGYNGSGIGVSILGREGRSWESVSTLSWKIFTFLAAGERNCRPRDDEPEESKNVPFAVRNNWESFAKRFVSWDIALRTANCLSWVLSILLNTEWMVIKLASAELCWEANMSAEVGSRIGLWHMPLEPAEQGQGPREGTGVEWCCFGVTGVLWGQWGSEWWEWLAIN